MARGKFANKRHFQMQKIETERIRELNAQINGLKDDLAKAKHETDVLRADINSKVMHAAIKISEDERQDLRNKIAQLEADFHKDRVKNAILAYEVAFRIATGKPPDEKTILDYEERSDGIRAAMHKGDIIQNQYKSAEQQFSNIHEKPSNLDMWIPAALGLNGDESIEFFKSLLGWKRGAGRYVVGRSHLLNARRLEYRKFLDDLWEARQYGYTYVPKTDSDGHREEA